MACRIGMKKKERKRERGRRDKERGREDNRLTSLEREDTRLGNTGPNAVRTVFEKKDFHCLFDGTIFDFLFFFKSFERGEKSLARKIRISVSHTWKRKVGKFFRYDDSIRFHNGDGLFIIDNLLLLNFHVDDI